MNATITLSSKRRERRWEGGMVGRRKSNEEIGIEADNVAHGPLRDKKKIIILHRLPI